jgi:hypothetical protein
MFDVCTLPVSQMAIFSLGLHIVKKKKGAKTLSEAFIIARISIPKGFTLMISLFPKDLTSKYYYNGV